MSHKNNFGGSQGYFGHFMSFGGYLDHFGVFKVFWSVWYFQGILEVLGLF